MMHNFKRNPRFEVGERVFYNGNEFERNTNSLATVKSWELSYDKKRDAEYIFYDILVDFPNVKDYLISNVNEKDLYKIDYQYDALCFIRNIINERRLKCGENIYNLIKSKDFEEECYQIGRESEDEELIEIIDRFLMESDKQR